VTPKRFERAKHLPLGRDNAHRRYVDATSGVKSDYLTLQFRLVAKAFTVAAFSLKFGTTLTALLGKY
jgi:hypothetical protein